MRSTTYKYAVQPGEMRLDLPRGARFLSVDTQGIGIKERPQMWFLIDLDAETECRNFVVFGTGRPVPEPHRLTHLGTFQIDNGNLVFHLFEVIP